MTSPADRYTSWSPMLIRSEARQDRAVVRALNTTAFGRSAEAELVDVLRDTASPLVSLVADIDSAIIGHILFSPVALMGYEHLRIMGLGPMAVAPGHQRRCTGSALVSEGLRQCAQLGCQAVVVLGYPEYYPRFGFAPAVQHMIRCEYEVPDDAFMVIELESGVLRGVSGIVHYAKAFDSV